MQYLGINYEMKHAPKLDPTFIPFGVWRAAYLKDAKQPIAIAVERDKGRVPSTIPASTALPRWQMPTTVMLSAM
jgi:hypothetical protein